MDRQLFVDRILEAENLTDNLEDQDANSLLDWGIAHIDGFINNVSDDAAHERVTHLMGVMRGVNSLAANPAAITPAAIGDLAQRYGQALGRELNIDDAELGSVLTAVSSKTTSESVQYLMNWLDSKK